MNTKIKLAILTLCSGAVALNNLSCLARFLGDNLGDLLAFYNTPF